MPQTKDGKRSMVKSEGEARTSKKHFKALPTI